MCILLNVKKHEKTFALNVDIFKGWKVVRKVLKLVSYSATVYIRNFLKDTKGVFNNDLCIT